MSTIFNISDKIKLSSITPLLFDLYSGSAAAYSLRSLSSNTTNVVRVREDAGNTEQDFTAEEITDGTLLAFVGAGNNGYVTTWYDQSGNTNDATQSAAANQPKIVDSGVLVEENGKPAVDFNGVNQLSFTIGSPNSLSAFLVSKWDDLTTGVLTKGSSRTTGSTRDFDIFGNGTTLSVYFEDTSNNVDVISLGVFDTSFNYLISAFHQSGNIPKAALNSSLINGTISLGNLDTDQSTFNIGGSSGSLYQFDGKIKEAILYPSDQSSNRVSIEQNINDHYAIYAGSPISGLLYDYPSSAAAYSVRQLTIYDNGYKETLVRVRRDSDNAEVDVKADTNYEISLSSLTSDNVSLGTWIGSDSGYVTTWYDQSGNTGRDATQSTAANQPKIVDAGVLVEENGKPAVDFDGVDDRFTTSNGLALPLFNIAVVKYGEALKSGAYAYTGQGQDRISFGMGTFTPTNAFWAWTPLILSSYGEANSRDLLQHIHTYYIPDAVESNWKYYRDSVEKGGVGLSSGTPLTTAGASLYIGYSGFSSEYWTGPIQEIIYYPSDQSSNRVGIETNINNHYNIY